MPDRRVRALDPLGVVALANILVQHGVNTCSCEDKPGPGNGCSCENKPVPCSCQQECSCENKPVHADVLDMVSNPVFREVVKGLDINKLKTIEDFLSIADVIRAKIDSPRISTRSRKSKKSK